MKIKAVKRYNQDIKILLVALGYFLFARLGYFLVFEDIYILPTWPPSGLALAFMLILGRKIWPGITIGALLANILAYWNSAELSSNSIIVISSVIATGHTIEALLGNFLIVKFIGNSQYFHKTKNVFSFLFIAIGISLLSATVITGILYLYNLFPLSEFLNRFVSLWVGNLVGILLFTPFILSLKDKINWRISSINFGELIFFLVAIGSIYFVLQNEVLRSPMEQAIPFLALPLLLWLAFRFHLSLAMSGTIIAALLAVYITTQNMGPFVMENTSNAMLLLQIFIGVISISTIVLSATEKERSTAQQKLEHLNESLEDKVRKRTEELEQENTTRKLAEMALKDSNSQLRKTNSELDNFVYRVSHDLRAPIASMLGLLHLVKKDGDNEMRDLYIRKIEDSAKLQDNFITEILDQSRNSRLAIKKEKVDFEKIINETFDQLKYSNPDETVKKKLNIQQTGDFESDPWRLKVILNNLISNSIRYRNGRAPAIDISIDSSPDHAKITVKDNGRGIAKKHIPKIYNMFYRATDDNAGSGLGLYIVKETVDKLGGKISIDSIEKKGTTVTLEIPSMDSEANTNSNTQAKI